MTGAVRDAIAAALGSAVAGARPLSGGDINQAYALTLSDGRVVFAKTNANADPAMFPAEARGLSWLREAGALRVPDVLAVSSGGTPAFLVLESIVPAPRARDFDQRLGRGLAALHRFGAPSFGLDHDNFIGRLPQENAPLSAQTAAPASPAGTVAWADFYRARRLEPQLRRATNAGLTTARMRQSFERLFAALPTLVGPEEPPCRLHGDLWGGNLLVDNEGHPCLIDPAVYGGHREVDLAMMHLFGGFRADVFAAYDEAWPLADGHEDRVALYQLYPLLVHVNLFGGSYLASVEAALSRLV